MPRIRNSEFRSYAWIKSELQKAGWNVKNPSIDVNGEVYYQQECLDHTEIKEHLGNQKPEFVIKLNELDFWVIEAKAETTDLEIAFQEAVEYGKDINNSNIIKAKIVTGVAGTDPNEMFVKSAYLEENGEYKVITYNREEITSLITKERAVQLLSNNSATLEDLIPDERMLITTAEDINEVMHDGSINKDARAKVISALLLSMIGHGGPDIRADIEVFVDSINSRARQILRRHNKENFYESIRLSLPERQNAQRKFQQALVKTYHLLHKIDIKAAMNSGTDVLGKFYEVFLKYGNGAKDIGIVLTPRHVTQYACEVLNIRHTDIVYDPTCGTGGFLVAAFDYVRKNSTPHQVQVFKEHKIFGIEQDSTITALAIVNMIFRGDGKSNIINDDCFPVNLKKRNVDGVESAQYSSEVVNEEEGEAEEKPVTKVLMNPPFSKKSETEKEQKFVHHALDQMEDGGLLFAIVPTSVMIKGGALKKWREQLLEKNTLLAVLTLPEDLFYPVGTRTVGVFIKKGISHPQDNKVLWAKVNTDGFIKSKGRRLPSNRVPNELETIKNDLKLHLYDPNALEKNVPEFIKTCPINFEDGFLELMPEVYLDEKEPTIEELADGADEYFREYLAYLIKAGVRLELNAPDTTVVDITPPHDYKLFPLSDFIKADFTSGSVHAISDVYEGDIPLISCKTEDNGIVGYYDVELVNQYNHCFTIAGDGSFPLTTYYHYNNVGSYDNVTIAPLKEELSLSTIFFLASRLNRMRWRYSYGRKCYSNKVKELKVLLPVNEQGELDVNFIFQLFEKLYGWNEISSYIEAEKAQLVNQEEEL
ncbi:N-6 DNA methylase [Bacillus altitudinis]|uniref:N-6 DNA methylase n=1 Tax=Bacillus altitudinis TaxID=293387 RepID=UPI0007769957|nr:N-6 DNA methylase [Bacillus altitudinis]MCI9885467.1 N-6 DNA methylase [Bacillus altitudinis]